MTNAAFAAIKFDGSVITWGESGLGSDSSKVENDLASGVQQIYSTRFGAFAAVKNDGSVITWGDSRCGGDSSKVKNDLTGGIQCSAAQPVDFIASAAPAEQQPDDVYTEVKRRRGRFCRCWS